MSLGTDGGWNLPPGCSGTDVDRAIEGPVPPHRKTQHANFSDLPKCIAPVDFTVKTPEGLFRRIELCGRPAMFMDYQRGGMVCGRHRPLTLEEGLDDPSPDSLYMEEDEG